MAVGVLLITHSGIGESLLEVATSVFASSPLAARAMSVPRDADPDACLARAQALADGLDDGDGVLVLADLFGATPCNIALRLCEARGARLVAGVNLPMLLRVFNYAGLTLDELQARACEGGRNGVTSAGGGE